jgi:tetratricopeptide (TPR) repeat protein
VDYIPSVNYVRYRLPPVYYPAELAYGPQAVKQFMGVDRNFALGPLTYTVYDAAKDAARAVDLKPAAGADIEPEVRVSNARTLALARRYVDFGDGRFRDQKFHEALQRYKTAIAIAPGLADAHIRHGLASVATGRYEAAVESIVRGIQLDPDWPAGGFALDDVYADSRAAKTGHLEALARTALADKGDANALYLLGVLLYLDGHKDRAQKFFLRAAELFGNDKATRPFVDVAEPAAGAPAARAPVAL